MLDVITSFQKGAGMRVFIFPLEAGAVPAMTTQLVLTLVYPDLHPLYSGRCNIRVLTTQIVLSLGQLGVCLAHGVWVQVWLFLDVQAQDVILQASESCIIEI